MRIPLPLICLMVPLLVSCKKDSLNDKLVSHNSRLAADLRSSNESHSIADNNLVLTTYFWRDFMPGTEAAGSRLTGVIQLGDANGRAIPPSIRLKRLYVVKGHEIWTTDFSEITLSDDGQLEGVVRNGPYWGPNINVDVVCEFEASGRVYRIIARSQPINRTD